MLSRPWSHPVALNTGPLDWESSSLTTYVGALHFTLDLGLHPEFLWHRSLG